MVSNEEIRRRLEAKRRGEKFEEGRPVHEVEKHVSTVGRSVQGGKTCPSCKTENPENAKFCVGCGETLKEPSAAETSRMESITELSGNAPTENVSKGAETTAESGTFKTCPDCHQPNPQEAKFCVVCGNKFEDEASTGAVGVEEPVETEEIAEEVIPDAEPEAAPEKVPEKEEPPQTDVAERSGKEVKVDPVERIKEAKELLDMGAITQEEFDRIKNKYLDQI